jgi:hypothetical protein
VPQDHYGSPEGPKGTEKRRVKGLWSGPQSWRSLGGLVTHPQITSLLSRFTDYNRTELMEHDPDESKEKDMYKWRH